MEEVIGAGAVTCETLSKDLNTPNATVWITETKNQTREVVCARLEKKICGITKQECEKRKPDTNEKPKLEIPASLTTLDEIMDFLVQQDFHSIKDVEKALVIATLRATDGNKSRSARILAITPATLFNKLKLYEQHTKAQR
jgi:DNA-binding NtrC family response regulator